MSTRVIFSTTLELFWMEINALSFKLEVSVRTVIILKRNWSNTVESRFKEFWRDREILLDKEGSLNPNFSITF